MKKRYVFLGMTPLMASMSCHEPCHDISATFKNNSGRNVTAYSYKKPYEQPAFFVKKIEIKNESSIAETGEACAPEWGDIDFYMLFEGDSIVIDFGDRTTYFSRRLRNGFTGQLRSNHNVYTLTPEDYESATPKQ